MAGINRTNSPMNLYQNDYSNTKEQLDKAREIIIDEQNRKPSFLVGSIDRVNERIAALDRDLQSFATALVIESRASDPHEDSSYPPADNGSVKARDVQELNQFAGVFSVKSTLDKIQESKYLEKTVKTFKKKKDTKATKPKLVELFQFSGFEEDKLTPLPEVDSALTVLERVTDAQKGLDRKPHYRDEFRRLFNSKMSEAVLVDSFWWFFLDHYHPDKNVQPRLFNRVAHNYVKLLMSADHPKYRDVFFLKYADLLAQAMYAAFCAGFPDSWRQFDDNFISGICELTSLWVVGTKPCPESWKGWNFEKLEPKDFRKEAIMKQDTKKGNILNLDFSLSDISYNQDSALGLSEDPFLTDNVEKTTKGSSASAVSVALSMRHRNIDEKSIDCVAHVQSSSVCVNDRSFAKQKTRRGSILRTVHENRDRSKGSIPDSSPSFRGQRLKSQSLNMPKPLGVKQSRSNSFYGGGQSLSTDQACLQSPRLRNSQISVSMETKSRRLKIKSHPVAAGPTFNKYVFNVSGQSPLVRHFLQKKGLQKKAGTEVLLQRTEIDQLPPSDSETYQDVIHDAFQSVKLMDEGYQRLYEEGLREHADFIRKQKRLHKEHMRRENALMSQPREVKRLSDLLVLELLKDPDEVNTGAAQAVEEALLHQDRDQS